MKLKSIIKRPSSIGIIVGMFLTALSLTPSLIPRMWTEQAIIAGITFVCGYGIGVGLNALWRYLQLPRIPLDRQRSITLFFFALAALWLAFFMFRMLGWQNSVRQTVGLEPLDSAHPLGVLLLAALVGMLLLLFFRLLWWLAAGAARLTNKIIPRRVGQVLGIAVGLVFVAMLINGVLVDTIFDLLDRTYSLQDDETYANVSQPTSSLRSGSPESLAAWDTLGKEGRRFVATGPSVEEIAEFWGEDARAEPIRIYIGDKSAPTLEARAELALQELQRTNAFERQVLVLVTSTGNGWIDANAVDAIEYMFRGDTAIVGFQYSYLPSLYSILADWDAATDASVAMFDEIHPPWRQLETEDRPEFYLYALSLGSYGSQAAIANVAQFNDPIDGALWAGPPFVSLLWQTISANRDPGTPAWRPVYQDGQTVRFTNQGEGLQDNSDQWLDNRLVYLQQADDPIVLFRLDSFYRELDWLKEGQRSPKAPPEMEWYPVVTFWQLVFDMVLAVGDSLPDGNGHRYSSDAYIRSWHALAEPPDWTTAQSEALVALFEQLGNLNKP